MYGHGSSVLEAMDMCTFVRRCCRYVAKDGCVCERGWMCPGKERLQTASGQDNACLMYNVCLHMEKLLRRPEFSSEPACLAILMLQLRRVASCCRPQPKLSPHPQEWCGFRDFLGENPHEILFLGRLPCLSQKTIPVTQMSVWACPGIAPHTSDKTALRWNCPRLVSPLSRAHVRRM